MSIFDEPLDWKKSNEELICQIKKNTWKLYGNKAYLENEKGVPISFINKHNFLEDLPLIPYIKINYNVQKKDVYINITKLFNKETDKYYTRDIWFRF